MADDTTPARGEPNDAKDDPEPSKPEGDVPAEFKAALRKANKEAETLRLKLKELEDKDKSELDKLRDEVANLTKERDTAAAQALRMEVAAEKGVKARWLTGSTREELEAAAEEYLADHPPATGGGPAPSKPTADLRGGGDPTEEPAVDVRKIVESIPRS